MYVRMQKEIPDQQNQDQKRRQALQRRLSSMQQAKKKQQDQNKQLNPLVYARKMGLGGY